MTSHLFRIVSKMIAITLMTFGLRISAHAEGLKATPLQLSLWNPVQLFPDTWDVYGLRLNMIYGNNRGVYGVDLGVVNKVTEEIGGIQLGLMNFVVNCKGLMTDFAPAFPPSGGQPRVYGLQMGMLNIEAGRAYALQVGCGNSAGSLIGSQLGVGPGISGNGAYSVTGCQMAIGLLISDNWCREMTGVQLSAAVIGMNHADLIGGAQIGIYNQCDRLAGVQLGLINICDRLAGVQIGLVNIIKQSPVPFIPIFNVSISSR